MYSSATAARGRDMASIDANLRALREEARTGYGKDDIRRAYIQAELVAQREARERQLQQQVEARAQARAAATSCVDGVAQQGHSALLKNRSSSSAARHGFAEADTGGAPRGGGDGLTGGSVSFLEAPWANVEDDFVNPLSRTMATDIKATTYANEASTLDGAAQRAMDRYHTLYQQLTAVADTYAYNAEEAVALGRVREWEPSVGLPLAWEVGAEERLGLGLTGGGGAAEFLDTLAELRATIVTNAREESKVPSRPSTPSTAASPICGLTAGRDGAGGGGREPLPVTQTRRSRPANSPLPPLRITGHRAVSQSRNRLRSSTGRSTRTTAGPTVAAGFGPLVPVSHARGFVAAVRQRAIRLQQEEQHPQQTAPSQQRTSVASMSSSLVGGGGGGLRRSSVATTGGHGGNDTTAAGDSACRFTAVTEEAKLTRVLRLVTLLFCEECRRSFECDLRFSTNATACPHCGHAVPLPAAEEGLLPPRRPLDPEEALTACESSSTVQKDDGGGGAGVDAIGFWPPYGNSGGAAVGDGKVSDDEGFAAALAEVRRVIAADRAAKAKASGSPQQQQQMRSAVGVCTATPTSSASARMDAPMSSASSENWERALYGTYFLHLWDEVYHTNPA